MMINKDSPAASTPLDGQYRVKYNLGDSKLYVVNQHTLKSLFATYRLLLWEPGNHLRNVSSFIGEIDEILLGQEFSVFTDEMLNKVTTALRERGNSNATINRKMAALSKLLRKALRMGEIHNLPEFRRQREKAGRIRFLETAEERELFAAVRNHSADAFRLCCFLVDTGCRLGEAIGLRWNDLNGSQATFWVTKSGRSRTVPLTERAKIAVSIEQGRSRGPFSMLNQAKFRAIWNQAKLEVGLGRDDQVVPHILRHTCASRLVQGGIDIRRVQMWLGHQTLQMTMRYAHLATNDLDPCVDVLERRGRRTPDRRASAHLARS